MCGRFAFDLSWAQIHALLGLTTDLKAVPTFITPRFNAAPTQLLPVAVARDGTRELEPMHWGLVPSWAKDRSMAARLINARRETVHEKPAFRDAFRRRRCLVPASGFYEWKKPARRGGRKQPYFFKLKTGEGFAMAGLWEQNGPLRSFTVLTTRANALVAELHDRMPVILPHASFETWLGEQTAEDLPSGFDDLLVPFDPKLMISHPVSTRVGSPANDDVSLMEPIDLSDARRSDGDDGGDCEDGEDGEDGEMGLFSGI